MRHLPLDVSVPVEKQTARKKVEVENAVGDRWGDPKREVSEIVKNSCVPIFVGHALSSKKLRKERKSFKNSVVPQETLRDLDIE